jgi:hypothetical protein
MAATKAPPHLLSHDLEELIGLVRDADSVELKLTVPDEDRLSTTATLGIDPLAARLRQIWFFDTPVSRSTRPAWWCAHGAPRTPPTTRW